MNGRSATSIRRCMPGPHGGSTRSTASAAASATAIFSKRVFHKLMLNFTWWVNRKDAEGRNVFQGGFLGLDNIGIFDRSAPLPTGGHINQADGTAWMAMYSLNLMRIALALAEDNHVYEDVATKFFEHFLYIAQAMTNIGGSGIGLWDEEDEFYYDVLHLPGRQADAVEGALDGRADPALRGRGARRLRLPAHARIHPQAALVPRLPARSRGAGVALERPEQRGASLAVVAARSPDEASARPHARRERVPLGVWRPGRVEAP